MRSTTLRAGSGEALPVIRRIGISSLLYAEAGTMSTNSASNSARTLCMRSAMPRRRVSDRPAHAPGPDQ